MALVPNGVGGPVRGAFRVTILSPLMSALAANDTIASLRWAPAGAVGSTDANSRFALLHARATAQIVTPFSAAQEILIAISVARTFTAADIGGSVYTPLVNPSQSLTSGNTYSSLLADLRVSSGATLTPGTRTLDNSLCYCIGAQMQVAASAAVAPIVGEYKADQQRPTPQILLPNEGLVVQNKIAFGAAGTVRFTLELEWAEFLPNSG